MDELKSGKKKDDDDDIAPLTAGKLTKTDEAPLLSSAKNEKDLETLLSVSGSSDFKTKSGYISTKSDKFWDKLTSKYGMGYTDLQYEYINNQNGIRDEISQRAMSWGSDSGKTTSSYEEKALDYMTSDEVAVFNYLYQTEGKDKAQEFLDVLAETLSYRKAGKDFSGLQGNTAREILFGVESGTHQFEQGVKNLGNMIKGDDDYIAQTSTQILSGMVREDLADDGFKVLGNSLGQMGYDVLNTGANMVPSIAVGALNPAAGAALMGASAAGNAYQQDLNESNDKEAARLYATTIGALEGTLQYLLGGIGKLGGMSSTITRAVSGIKNGALRFSLEYGGKIASEALEEGLQEVLDPIVKNAIHGTDENVDWENVAYSAFLGVIMSAGFGASEVSSNRLSNNEAAVVNKEFSSRVAKEEQNGKKLSNTQKNKIYDAVLEDMEKGRISIDTIEEVLGGDSRAEYESLKKESDEFDSLYDTTYEKLSEKQRDRLAELKAKNEKTSYKDALKASRQKMYDSVYELAKGDRLVESYNEEARKKQDFVADYSKYEGTKYPEAAKKTIESIIKLGVNNTNRVHDFADLAAKTSAKTGIVFTIKSGEQVKADFIENQTKKIAQLEAIAEPNAEQSKKLSDLKKLLEQVKSGEVTVNGDITEDGIVLSLDSKKPLNRLVGHEITHSFEPAKGKKSKGYDALKKHLFAYAKTKGIDIDSEINKRKLMYDGVANAEPEAELVADLVGDFLFSDSEYISRLSVENRNLFQRLYDEVKHLFKLATAGSREARELERVMRDFERLYHKGGKSQTANKHSLAMVEKVQPKSDKWSRTHTTEEAMARFPNMWNIASEESEVRNPTQITSTVNSYRKIYNFLQNEGFNGTILDASSGLGYGTKAGIEEYGFDVEDIEPYPDKGYNPKYKDYSTLNKKYDVIISNAVLNVLPQDQRDALAIKMGELLNDGGRMFINVRGKDVESLAKTGKNIHLGNMEWIETVKGSYQKGFTKDELKAYLEDALGDGFTVEKTNMFGAVSVVVTKNSNAKYSLYSRPDFNQKEWAIVNRRKHSEFYNPAFDLDKDRKWMYVNEKGSKVFAVYSKHDVDDPTVLYGSRGTAAEKDYEKVVVFREGGRNAKRGRGNLDRLLAAIERNEGNWSDDITHPEGAVSATEDVPLPFGESRSNRPGNYGDGREAIEEHPIKYDDEASDDSGASFVTFSNDYAAIRNFMKEGDSERKYSLPDSNGRQLSNEQAEYFKDSKVRDESGNLKVMYHGTSKGGFNVFDTYGSNYGLFGTGSYFTDSKTIGESYTKKGKGKNPQVYEAYLNIKNPMDMDAAADPAQWVKAFPDADFPESGTNEQFYRAVEEFYADQWMSKWEVAEEIQAGIESSMGYDGITHIGGGRVNPNGERHQVYIAFQPEQIKNVDNAKPTESPDIRYSLSNADTDKSYLEAVNSGDTETARKIMEQVAKRRGYTIHAYHGTARGDRVGNVFLPERATSGPMAFFTDNKEIAENYSKSKQDTSMAYDPDYDRYETQFRIKVLDRDIPLYRAWGYLPFDARRRISQKAGQLRENWDGDNELILDPDTNEANGGFQWQLKEARGNAIQALTEQWLNSGNLFNEEAKFLEVLEMAGVTEEFKKVKGIGELYFKDPNAKHEKVYDTFLRIRKPFDTATVDEQFIADLESWYEEQDQSKYVRENMQSDMWDKNGIDAYDFADRLRSDLENNTTHAWTSIPDSATDYLKHLGYDGIKDTGGKFTLEGHTVWIPFSSSQIKSAETVTYDDAGNVIPITERFDKKEVDIRKSLSFMDEVQEEYGKSNVDEGFAPLTDFDILGEDLLPQTAPSQEEVAPVAEESSVAEMFPDEPTPQIELDALNQEKETLESRMMDMANNGDFSEFESVNARYTEVSGRIAELEGEISESESGRLDSIGDEDVPPEMDAPYYGEPSKPESAPDPFMGRDMDEVAKSRKTKAYQYENPEVKPYFMDAAYGMLGDLNETVRGEKIFNGDVYYESGGEKGWMGTKRQTTDDIAWLKDTYGYTYDQIRDGVNAIIEDDGKENNAVSKRIEFLLHDRLVNGYTGVWGEPIPPNQEYISFLKEREVNEYSREAFDSFMATADQYAPMEDIAPVATPAAPKSEDIAPIKEEYVAVTPKRKKEPKMVRADKPFDQKPANVLVNEPKVEKKKNGLWSMVKENVLDNGMVFEDLALKTKNRDLQAKWNFIRYAQSMAQRMVGNGTENVKSLDSIRQEVEKSGKTQEFYEYLYHWLNVDRMTLENRYDDTKNKAVFGDSVTADMSRAVAVQLGKKNPEFRRWAQDVYRYNSHLRTMMVNNGVISQETAELWQAMYPHYVPIRRVGDKGLNINVPLDTGRTGVNAPIKKATGGNSDILPLFDTMAQRTLQTYKAIAKNSFGVELKNTLGTTITKEQTDVDGVLESVDNHEELLQKGKNGKKPTFTVFENGEKVTFEITDEMYNAMKPAGDLMSYTNPVANRVSNFHRGLLTEYNPVFMATNAIKDTQDILINSQHPVKTYANLPRATWEIAKNGKWFREYMEHGGEDNTYFDGENNSFDTEEKGARKLLGIPPLSWISKANNFIERTPRLAEYIASRESGRSIEVSMLDAARVTTNFAAGGKLTKLLNRNGATFLNASVQGVVQQARNFREAKMNGLKGWAQLAGKFALAGLPAMLLNGLMWDDDDEYEELSDYVKQNYYIVGKYGDGKFVRIPKGRTLAVIQNAFEQMENAITGDDEVDLMSFVKLVVSNLAPNNPVEDNILAPIIQVSKNETWYGEDLVPTRLQDLPAAEQFDESTDAISKWLGEKLNFSPYKINYLLDQYSGGVGDTILPMLTPEAESGDNTLLGNMLAPWKSKFTTDSVMNNQNVADFYDVKDELTTNAKSSKATDEDVLMSKYMNAVNAELSDLYAQKREIQNSGLSAAEKYAQVRNIQSQIVSLTKEGLATYKDIVYEGEYARIGDRLYTKNDEGEWQKLSDEQVTKYEVTKAAGDAPYATDGTNHYRWYEPGEDAGEDAKPGWRKVTEKELERQNEVTSGLGITPEEYWGNKDEYSFAYDNPESYAVAKAVGGYKAYKQYSADLNDIKADKDKYGKTISGSRKTKVMEYINSLDADYYTKLILYKSEYTSYDDENYEIIEYLNGRKDISFEEEIDILRKLGFSVTAEGNISW